MKTSVGLLAGLLALAVEMSTVALAQTYPSRPIRIIVPYPAGGVLDTITRAIGEQARHSLGQPWIIENRMGEAAPSECRLALKARRTVTPSAR